MSNRNSALRVGGEISSHWESEGRILGDAGHDLPFVDQVVLELVLENCSR